MNNQAPVLAKVDDSFQIEHIIDGLEELAVDVRKEATSLVCSHHIPNDIIGTTDGIMAKVGRLRAELYSRDIIKKPRK